MPQKIRNPEIDFQAFVGISNADPGESELLIKKIHLTADKSRHATTLVGKKLASIAQELTELDHLENEPNSRDRREKLLKDIRNKTFHTSIDLNLKRIKPDVKIGDSITFTAVAEVVIDGQESQLIESKEVIVAATLKKLDGWVVGDGHIHTNYSPDVKKYFPWVDVETQARAGKNAGLDYVIITDHDDGLEGKWSQYVKDCTDAQATVGISVVPGEEITSTEGDYLAYKVGHHISRWTSERQKSGQEVVNEVNREGGFGFIAHPYKRLGVKWSNWDVSDFTGLEILSAGSADRKALRKWNDLAEHRRNWVGVGNSDAHLVRDVGNQLTYVYTGGSRSQSSIHQALKSGYAVTSDGPMVNFTAKGKHIGQTLIANKGEQIDLNIEWPEGQNLYKLRVVLNGHKKSYKVTDTDNQNHSKTIPITVDSSGFVRVEAVDVISGVGYTNPIFLDVPERIPV